MNGRSWTPQEIEALKNLYPHYSGCVVSRVIGRSESTIFKKAAKLGIGKTAEYLASSRSEQIQRGKKLKSIVQTHFKPGQTPWNKG